MQTRIAVIIVYFYQRVATMHFCTFFISDPTVRPLSTTIYEFTNHNSQFTVPSPDRLIPSASNGQTNNYSDLKEKRTNNYRKIKQRPQAMVGASSSSLGRNAFRAFSSSISQFFHGIHVFRCPVINLFFSFFLCCFSFWRSFFLCRSIWIHFEFRILQDVVGVVAKLSECIASRGGNINCVDVFVPENKKTFYSRR